MKDVSELNIESIQAEYNDRRDTDTNTNESNDYAGIDYYQFFVETWERKNTIKDDQIDPVYLREHYERMLELGRVADSKKNIAYVISLEVSSNDSGNKGRRIHFQGVIVSQYEQRKNSQEKIIALCKNKGLDAKKKDYGFCRGKMSKSLEENIKYVLKDQGCLFIWKGFSIKYLESLREQWIKDPQKKLEVIKSSKPVLCEKCKTDTRLTYTQIVARDILLKITDRDSLADVCEAVGERVRADKARLPVNTVLEIARHVALESGIITKTNYYSNLASKIM